EEGDGDPLPLLHPLVDEQADPAAGADGLQHPAGGSPLGDDAVAEALAQVAELAVEPRVVRRADDDVDRAAVEAHDRGDQLPEAQMGGEHEDPPAEALGLLHVLPAFQGEPPAHLPRVEARGGNGVAEGGAEVAEALPHQALPLGLRHLGQRQGHVAQGYLAVPAVEGVSEAPHGAAHGARRRVRHRPQEPLQGPVEPVLDAVLDGAVLHAGGLYRRRSHSPSSHFQKAGSGSAWMGNSARGTSRASRRPRSFTRSLLVTRTAEASLGRKASAIRARLASVYRCWSRKLSSPAISSPRSRARAVKAAGRAMAVTSRSRAPAGSGSPVTSRGAPGRVTLAKPGPVKPRDRRAEARAAPLPSQSGTPVRMTALARLIAARGSRSRPVGKSRPPPKGSGAGKATRSRSRARARWEKPSSRRKRSGAGSSLASAARPSW